MSSDSQSSYSFPVSVIGATGMVGQQFVRLLSRHPWFHVVAVAASPRSADKRYAEAVADRWFSHDPIPDEAASLIVQRVEEDMDDIVKRAAIVFSALDMEKSRVCLLEEEYASRGAAVVSNNSAHRWTDDVPMVMPEINPNHLSLIPLQRSRRGWEKGCIVVKPNCSLQSYVPPVTALFPFGVQSVSVATYQAVSGAGKTIERWPEIQDNVIPFISGEEEKSEQEPLKIWGRVEGEGIVHAAGPFISATCVRVPVSDGHLAVVEVTMEKDVSEEDIYRAWEQWADPLPYPLPSKPVPFIRIRREDDRPQIRLDRMEGEGMGVIVGRLRRAGNRRWKFVCLSHNTIRGAAGGAVLTAELLIAEGILKSV